jgi:conjugative transfer signal peptidase TraF
MILIVAIVATLALLLPKAPCLVWNATASVPIGLYVVSPPDTLARGNLVLAEPPEWAHEMAAQRGFLPLHVPLVKRIAALSGDRLCSFKARIILNGHIVAARLAADAHHRPLPSWRGCRLLRSDDVFLLLPDVPGSFDGRYFGPVSRGAILGKLRLLWHP